MPLATGTRLGPYEIHSPLGAGGMGEVYRAHDNRLDRTVAVKILPASFAGDHDRLQRFAQEARAAAALNHPNILSIFDVGEDSGNPYVVSELLEGETLRARLHKGPLPLRKALNYALQIAHGLTAAHQRGIIHRDLKPDNLFITGDDRVKILDFGLAKLVRQPDGGEDGDTMTVGVATEAGVRLGTVGYMSPEQVRGKPALPESDIFSFGAVLYEMLAGKRAFRRDTSADTLSAILHEEPPDLSESSRNVPAALERIVRHCLEKNPTQRFHSAGDLAFDLEALADLTSSKSGAVAQLGASTSSRHKLTLGAGAVAVLAAALGLAWWLGRRSVVASVPEYQQITFRSGIIGNARFTPDGSVVYNAAWDGGPNQLYLTSADDPASHELGVKDATVLAISRNGELTVRLNTLGFIESPLGILASVPLSGGAPREVLDNVREADWAPDGLSMAVIRFVPANSHWQLEYPVGKVLYDGINWITHPRISPDGKLVAFSDHENAAGDDMGSLAVLDMEGHERKLSSGWTSMEGIAWSPDGDEIWFTATKIGSSLNLRGVTLSGKLRTIATVPGGMVLQDVRNGVALFVTQQDHHGIRGISPGGKEERELGWFGWSVLRDISRDGTKVLFEEEGEGGGPNYSVFLRDTDGSPPLRMGEGRGQTISPDGKWVITQTPQGGSLNLVPTGVGEARQLTHDKISYGRATYLPDGKYVMASGIEEGHGARSYLVDVSTGNAKPVTPDGVAGTLVSPDGRFLAVTGPDKKWAIWPLDGTGLRPIPGLGSEFQLTGWSPDGSSLYAVAHVRLQPKAKVYRVNVNTGKMEYWKTLGVDSPSGISSLVRVLVSADGSAYAYGYGQRTSEVYLVRGLR